MHSPDCRADSDFYTLKALISWRDNGYRRLINGPVHVGRTLIVFMQQP